MTIGGKAAGKGIAVMCSSKVLALCGRVLSVLPLKLDNKNDKIQINPFRWGYL